MCRISEKILFKAKFSSSNTISIKRCSDPWCETCDFIQEGEGIIKKNSGQILKPNVPMNCKSFHIIYCATCPISEENYNGQTNQFNARVRVHKQQIKDEQCWKLLKIFPLYKMWTNKISFSIKFIRHEAPYLEFMYTFSFINSS